MQILGETVRAAGRQGRHDLCSFWNEWVAGVGRQNLRNFLEEQAKLTKGLAGKDSVVFGRNCPGAWQPKLCRQWAARVTVNQNCVIPRGN